MKRLAVLALSACGRLQFSPLADDARSGDSGSDGSDAAMTDAMADAMLPVAGLTALFECENSLLEEVNQTSATCSGMGCPSYTTGRVGQASAQFDGNDCITLNGVTPIETPQITLALWVRHATSSNVSLLAKPLSTGSSNSWQLETDFGNMNNLAISFVVADNFTNVNITTPLNTVVMNTWQHVAATYDGTTKRLYVDGVELATGSHPSLDYDGKPLKIGCDDNGGGNTIFYLGEIDDVRIYNRALSAAEIGQLAAQ